jgi:hypothetical protein
MHPSIVHKNMMVDNMNGIELTETNKTTDDNQSNSF